MSRLRAPKHLRPETARWWREVLDAYAMESHHVKLLTLAAESWDRLTAAREAIALHGSIFIDRFAQPKRRPEVQIEQSERVIFARLLRELNLDAPAPDSRPPGLRR